MRILHVISGLDPENGGPTFALVGLAEAQARYGLKVSVIATWQIRSGFPLADRLRAAGVDVTLIGQAHGKLSRHPMLATAVDEAVGNADVVNIHALWEEIQHRAARAAQRRGVPYVVTPHGMLSPWSQAQGSLVNRWGKRLYLMARLRRNLSRAAAVHFTTTDERDLVAPMRLGTPTIVEPVGIDVREFDPLPPRGLFRAAHPSVGDRPIILFLSRLSPQKGLDRLIPAFAKCVKEGSVGGAMLVLAGPDYDGYSQVAHHLVASQGIEDRVVFTGMLHGPQRVEALVDAGVFVLPSRHENFGIAVIEALAAGTPVVISREVNIWREIIAAGAGAAVSGEQDQLAAEMTRWLNNSEIRRDAGEKGKSLARAAYSWDVIAKSWVEHYRQLIDKTVAVEDGAKT